MFRLRFFRRKKRLQCTQRMEDSSRHWKWLWDGPKTSANLTSGRECLKSADEIWREEPVHAEPLSFGEVFAL